jgi:hypothetical protein
MKADGMTDCTWALGARCLLVMHCRHKLIQSMLAVARALYEAQ